MSLRSRHALALAVTLTLWRSAAGAEVSAPAALEAAIQLHQEGQFEQARDALVLLLETPDLPEAVRIKAQEYLASSYLALKNPDRAAALLKDLLRSAPQTVIDPSLFVPELILLEQRERLELKTDTAPHVHYPGRRIAWVPGALTLASGAVSIYCLAEAFTRYGQLTGPSSLGPINPSLESVLTRQGRNDETGAGISLGAAIVALAITGVLWFWHEAPQVAFAPRAQGGGMLVTSGELK
jgi:tetratricopeptide (TPR) repeat protein